MAEAKEATRFRVRVIFKGCHQVSPDDFVTEHYTRDAVLEFEDALAVFNMTENLAGIELLGVGEEKGQ